MNVDDAAAGLPEIDLSSSDRYDEWVSSGGHDHWFRAEATPAEVAERDKRVAGAQQAMSDAVDDGDQAAFDRSQEQFRSAWYSAPAGHEWVDE